MQVEHKRESNLMDEEKRYTEKALINNKRLLQPFIKRNKYF